jgi:hypothetical protein
MRIRVTETGFHRKHMRMVRLQKMGIIRIHEDVGYRSWVYPEHLRMWVTETGYHRNT